MVEQLKSQDLSAGPRDLQFILAELPHHGSRRNVVYAMSVLAGQPVGQMTIDDEPVVAAAETNTGNGALTLAEVPTGPGVRAGEYVVEITGGTFAATTSAVVPAPGSSGNGVLTLASPAFGVGVTVGEWIVECSAPATGGGTFDVMNPAGVHVGVAVEGAAYEGLIKFQIDAGNADFEVGDKFIVTVVDAVPANGLGIFTVTDPQGVKRASGIVGTAYDHELRFTLADDTNFIVGDSISVTVAVGDNTFGPWDSTALDGRAVIAGFACYGWAAPAPGAMADGVILTNDAQVKTDLVVWPDHTDGPTKAAAAATIWSTLRIRIR